jgi:hypothetical protein
MKPLHIQSLEKILNDLKPDYIPHEFVAAASIMTSDGSRQLFTGDEYCEFLRDNSDEIIEVRVMIDMEKASQIIEEITFNIFKNIE